MTEASSRPLRVALLGTRGIPGNYSGFETCVEQVATRLAARGHSVTVYCRSYRYEQRLQQYRGVRLVHLPTLRWKHAETLCHTMLSVLHGATQRFDACIFFIAGNAPMCGLARALGGNVAINVDGLDWRREKWSAPARAYLKWCERASRWLAHEVVTDSRAVVDFYRGSYGFEPRYIAYGSDVEALPPGSTLQRFGLEPGKYVLFVGRLVPENCVHHLVDAFGRLETELKCVIVGDSSYAEEYKRSLRATTDPRVVFTGYVFGEGYRELSSNAFCFVETSEVGGTHPALVEAMAFGSAVVVNGTLENRETIGDAGLAYDTANPVESLAGILGELLAQPVQREELARRARDRAASAYSWHSVTDEYEELCYRLADRS